MTCEKVGFATHREAMVASSNQRRKTRHRYQAYQCHDCGFYHLTTVTKTLKPHKEDKFFRKYPFRYGQNHDARKRKK